MPGTSSLIGAVSAGSGGYALGTISVDGQELKAYVSTVPEPEEYALMLAGLGVIGAVVRRRKEAQA
jgi:hypothetical protein